MMQALLIEGDRRTRLVWPTDRERWASGTGVLWLDVNGATSEEIEALGADLGWHTTVVRACQQPEYRARLKEFPGHFLLVLNAVGRGGSEGGMGPRAARWRTLELNIVVSERLMVTVHPEIVPAVTMLFRRYSKEGEGKPGLDYMLYMLCESVAGGYYSLLDRIDKHIDEAETQIFHGKVGQTVVDRLFTLKRHILYLRRVLGPQRDALGALMRREFPIFPPESRPYFLEVYEYTLRLFDLLDTYRDLISSSLDAYLSTVSNRMNEIMKMLTIVSTIMMPLTLLTGVFGMNFDWMPLIRDPWGFAITMLLMGMVVSGMVYYFRRRKWM